MKKIVRIRGLAIGEGRPKIAVPLVAEDLEELKRQLAGFRKAPADLAEFRADAYRDAEEPEALREALELVRAGVGGRPVLFTFRTAAEGGERPLSYRQYEALNLAAARSGLADLVDVELFTAGERAGELVRLLHEAGVKVVGSSHDFEKTPETRELIRRVEMMQEAGMDITKLAVWPRCRQDVLRLLESAVRIDEETADRPCITMSMGRLGMVSRLAGSFSGSAVTFAAAGRASAPGQLPARELKSALEMLDPAMFSRA